MARRSWKRNGVKGYAVGGMPDYTGQYVREDPEAEAAKLGMMSTARSALGPQGPQGMDAYMQSLQQRTPPQLGGGMPPQGMRPPMPGMPPQAMDPRMQQQLIQQMQQMQERGIPPGMSGMPPGMSGMPPGMSGMPPGTGGGMRPQPQVQPMQRPPQGMPPQPQVQPMQRPPQGGGMQQTVAQPGMRPPMPGMPQGMDPRMQQMQQRAMQMIAQRQQAMQQAGVTPDQLPSPQALRQMSTPQARQALGQTLLGPQGYQQMQRMAMDQAEISPQGMRNGMGSMGQQMGQRPPQQQAMGQQPQQRSPFQQGAASMGAAMGGARGFADGGSVDSRMAELDRYLSDPNLKMVQTKSGKFQFVPVNQPAKRKAAAPKPAAKPMAKAAPRPRANANAVPGTSGKMKTGGGGMKGIQRPLSAFTDSKVKPVKPTGMKASTPLPRDMTGVNQTPIRGRDIAGAMAKGAATGAMLGMGPGMARAGVGMLGKGVDKGLKMARKPLTESRMSNVIARARPGEVVPRLPGSAKTAGLGSKTARMPKASDYKSPPMKTGAAKRAAEALKKRNVTEEEAMDMAQGYSRGGAAKKAVPRGYHRMPNGRVMKNSAHKGKR